MNTPEAALLVLVLLDIRRMLLDDMPWRATVARLDEALALVVPPMCAVCGGLIHTADECSLAEEVAA